MDIKRVLTSVLGLPLVIAILVFGNTIVIDIFFAVVALISIKEFFGAFEKGGTSKPIKWLGYIVALSIAILRQFHLQSSLVDVDSDMMNIMFIAVIASVFISFFTVLNSGMKKTVLDGAVTIFGIVYIPVFLMFLPIIYSAPNGNGVILLGYVIICRLGNRYICILRRKIFWRKET